MVSPLPTSISHGQCRRCATCRITQDSVTEKLPLVGADGYFALEQQKERIAQESGLEVETVAHLLNRYGSLISEILEIIAEEPKLAAKLDADLNISFSCYCISSLCILAE